MRTVVLCHSQGAGDIIRRFLKNRYPGRKLRVFADFDDYSHGPLLTSGTVKDFFLMRHAFWVSLDADATDWVSPLRFWEEHICMVEQIRSADQVEIWIGARVQEIFFAITVLHLLALERIDTTQIFIREFSGDRVEWGLGSCRVDDLYTLHQSSKVEPIDAKLHAEAWNAISQGAAKGIHDLVGRHGPSKPITTALSAYLLRFPEYNDGLGSIDRCLLRAGTPELKNSAYTIGGAMALVHLTQDCFGDSILFQRLVELSQVSPDPWFRLEGDIKQMRRCSAQITDSGRRACAKYSVRLL